MKRLILFLLIIGTTSIFFSCSKDNSSDSDLMETTYLKAKKVHTHFSGICTPIIPIGDENAWYDETDDPRVTGVTIWVTEGMEPIDETTTVIWGTGELLMGAEEGDYEHVGKWETSWKSTMTLLSSGGFRIVAQAVGSGIDGEVLGLTAKWKYTMDYDGTPETMLYVIKGKITEEF